MFIFILFVGHCNVCVERKNIFIFFVLSSDYIMSSKSVPIGFQGLYEHETKSVIGFEGFKKKYENNVPTDYSSGRI